MGTTTKIEWTDKTWSPWMGCSEAGPGCDHCYAKAMLDTRLHKVKWGPGQQRVHTENWDSPLRWNKQAAARGHTIKVFPSVCDPFDNEVPPEWRRRFVNLIRDTPHLTWLLLTKRIGNAARMIAEATEREHEIAFALKPWPNVWIGATVVNQQEADRDIPKLLATPAAHRFVSIEPMLGAVDLRDLNNVEGWDAVDKHHFEITDFIYSDAEAPRDTPSLDWVIAGGESGPNARPSHPDWYRSLRDQCAAAGVPFLFKQWGELYPYYEEDYGLLDDAGNDPEFSPVPRPRTLIYNEEHKQLYGRIGKDRAGRQLDGREHLEFPPGLEPYVEPVQPVASMQRSGIEGSTAA